MTTLTASRARPIESLLADFAPDFDFVPAPPIPVAEYAERMRRMKREGVSAGLDALIVHTDTVGWFHASQRLSALSLRLDARGRPHHPDGRGQGAGPGLLLHPVGDPAAGRRAGGGGAHPAGRRRSGANTPTSPAISGQKTIEAVAKRPRRPRPRARGSIGIIGDKRSAPFKAALGGRDAGGAVLRPARHRRPDAAGAQPARDRRDPHRRPADQHRHPGRLSRRAPRRDRLRDLRGLHPRPDGARRRDRRRLPDRRQRMGHPLRQALRPGDPHGRPDQPLRLQRHLPGLHRPDRAHDRHRRAHRPAGTRARRLHARREGGGEADPPRRVVPRPQQRRLRVLTSRPGC